MNKDIYKSAMDKIRFSDDLNVKTLEYLDSYNSKKYNGKTQKPNGKKFYMGLTALVCILVLTVSMFMLNNNPIPIIEKDSEYHVDESSSYPVYSLEDLVIFSDIISIGVVTDISDPIEIKPVGGGDTDFFIDYTIEFEKIYKDTSGDSNGTKAVPLRIRTEKPGMSVGDNPIDFKIGDKHLFFLSYPTSGGGYTVDDDHILLTGGPQGLLKIKSQGVYHNDFYDTVETKKLLSIVNDPNIQKAAEKFDPLYDLKENLESGFITQEEYDRAIKDLSEYAEIVND